MEAVMRPNIITVVIVNVPICRHYDGRQTGCAIQYFNFILLGILLVIFKILNHVHNNIQKIILFLHDKRNL